MKRVTLILAALALLLGGVRQARAGFVAGGYNLYAYRADTSKYSNQWFSLDVEGAGGASTTLNTTDIFGNAASFTSSVSYRATYGTLGLQVSGTAINGGWLESPLAGGTASIAWQDSVSLVWKGDGVPVVLPGTNLDFVLRPEGSVSATVVNSPSSSSMAGQAAYASASVSITAGLTSLNQSVYSWSGGLIDSQVSAFPTITASYAIGQGGRTQFSYSLGVSVSTDTGTALSNFYHTLEPIAITFDNGQTPESLGYELVFDSGMQSPNISAVPEPSGLALLGTAGIIGLGYRGWRWRKGAVTA